MSGVGVGIDGGEHEYKDLNESGRVRLNCVEYSKHHTFSLTCPSKLFCAVTDTCIPAIAKLLRLAMKFFKIVCNQLLPRSAADYHLQKT
jgi:hypothetical protein